MSGREFDGLRRHRETNKRANPPRALSIIYRLAPLLRPPSYAAFLYIAFQLPQRGFRDARLSELPSEKMPDRAAAFLQVIETALQNYELLIRLRSHHENAPLIHRQQSWLNYHG